MDTSKNQEGTQESIKVNMDLVRLLTISIIATAGGFVSLVTRKDSRIIIELIIGVMVLLVISVAFLIILVIRNLKLLKQLRDV